MIAQRLGGDIIYISSKNSVFAGPNNIAYSATKADQAHQVRLLAAELGEHGIRVNGINPDGVVRGSGIFAGGWGAKRAAVYGVHEEKLGRVLRPAHPAQARGPARARGQRRCRPHQQRTLPHHRPAHPRGRRSGRSLPAMSAPRPACPFARTLRSRAGGTPCARGRNVRAHDSGTVGATVSAAVAAIDLGATSGRVMLGYVGHNELSVRPVARFPNQPVRTVDGLHWNILELYRSVVAGLTAAVREEPTLRSVAVDSWAVDYALMRGGRMLGTPYHYRDERNWRAPSRPCTPGCPPPSCTPRTDCSTSRSIRSTRLEADAAAGTLQLADSFLLIPDLVNFWLTGAQFAEQTNASTTGLLGSVPAVG